MLEILFGISFSLFGGNIIDIQLKHHKYEKEDYKEIFYLKNKESVNTYCVKHSRIENIQKKKYPIQVYFIKMKNDFKNKRMCKRQKRQKF